MTISDFLRPEAIALQMRAKDSEDVIRRLGDVLKRLGCVKDDFVEATLVREASMPTGLPLAGSVNAAIPHVDIEYVKHPALALATLIQPVTFHHMVEPGIEIPVQLVIMLALDKPKSQIAMLQQIATILQSTQIVDQLMAAKTHDEVFMALAGAGAPA